MIAASATLFVVSTTACARQFYTPLETIDKDLITFDQLSQVRNENALDAIRKVRPTFLMSRGPTTLLGTSSRYATVYLDGMRYGSIETLQQIPASWIAEARLYRVSTPGNFAQREFGGIIAITTRTR
jgi:hypothetical protein